MADDWRVEVDVADHDLLHRAIDRMRERGVARDARQRLGDHIRISVDADRMFAYADSRAEAEEAARVLRELAEAHHLEVSTVVARWHPEEERWEAPDVPLPRTPEEHAAERERRDLLEEAESRARQVPEWEVRVTLASPEEAEALERRLLAEAIVVAHEGKFLVAGADDEDEAARLEARIREVAPPGAAVRAGGSREVVWDDLHPFGFLGGLGN